MFISTASYWSFDCFILDKMCKTFALCWSRGFSPILMLFGLQTVILLRIWDLCKVLMDVHLIQPFVKAKEKQYLFLWWHSGALKHSGHCVSVIAFNKSNSLLNNHLKLFFHLCILYILYLINSTESAHKHRLNTKNSTVLFSTKQIFGSFLGHSCTQLNYYKHSYIMMNSISITYMFR